MHIYRAYFPVKASKFLSVYILSILWIFFKPSSFRVPIMNLSINYFLFFRMLSINSSSTWNIPAIISLKISIFSLISSVIYSIGIDRHDWWVSLPQVLHLPSLHLRAILHSGLVHSLVTFLPEGQSMFGSYFLSLWSMASSCSSA